MVYIVPPAALAGGAADALPGTSAPTSHQNAAPVCDLPAGPAALDDFATAGIDLETMASDAMSPAPTELPTVDVDAATGPNPVLPTPAELFWRKLVLWGSAGGVGVFLLGGLAGALWVRSSATDAQPNVPPAMESVATESDVDGTAIAVASDATADAPSAEINLPEPPEDLNRQAAEPVVDDPQETSAAVDESLAELPSLPAPQATVEEQPLVSADGDVAAERNDPPRREVDLLSFDPAYLDLAMSIANGSAVSDLEPVPSEGKPTHVASFEPVNEPPPPAEAPTSAAAKPLASETSSEVGPALGNVIGDADAAQEDVRAPVRRGPPSELAGARPSVDDQLAMPLGEIDVTGAPLDQWLESMSDLLAVPITLEPQELARAGVAANQPLVFQSSGATAADVLAESLGKYRLSCRRQGGQLVVVRSGMDTRRTQNYRVADLLADGQRDAQPIAESIKSLVEPATWESAGGTGRIDVSGTTLSVEHELGIHLDVLILLERMLLARDLPPKTRYPRERLSIASSYGQLLPVLDQQATFTFLPWTRLAEVVRYWREAMGTSILVDWQSLADVQLGPDSLVACSGVDQRWEDALAAILGPLDLTWRAVDGQTIQITTRAAAADLRTIEFYPVADLVRRKFSGPDELIAALKQSLGPDAAAARFVYDTGSGYLLVLAPGDAHRQLTKRLATM